MNSGQTMLVICAMTILSTLTLSINSSLMNSSNYGLNMQVNLDAISLAQSTLDEVLFNEFDEKTLNGVRAFSYSGITPANSLGPDGSLEIIAGIDSSRSRNFQSMIKFDDVDDYDGYTRKVWDDRLGWFDIAVAVKYVQESNPDVISSSSTFYKRVTVTVTHPNMIQDDTGNIIPVVMKDLSIYRRYF